MGRILLGQPLDLVDFLFYFQALQIVKLRLVALEGAVNIVLTLAVRLIFTLQGKQDNQGTTFWHQSFLYLGWGGGEGKVV